MGWPTKYKGPEIDAALEKGRNLRVVNNGWIRLDSSDSTPVSLGDLKNPGNYTVSFYTDQPASLTEKYNPINVIITKSNDIIYQIAKFGEIQYVRNIPKGSGVYGPWEIDQSEGAINPGPTPPANPIPGKTVWVDTTNPERVTIKLYTSSGWKEVVPSGAMMESVYDTQGKREDIFAYIDTAIQDASIGDTGADFRSHIEDNTIHVTEADKTKWNSAATKEDVTNAVSELENNLQSTISSEVNENITTINQLDQDINTVSTNLQQHTNNSTIHPSAEKQQEWDNKAAGDHGHNLDGKVKVDASNVRGSFTSEQLPYDVKERVYVVNSDEERLALQKNPVHNGDTVCVSSPDGSESWYFIVDDTKLGNGDPEEVKKAFKPISSGGGAVSWENISNKPTTIDGYGITDAASDADITRLEQQITDTSQNIPQVEDLNTLTTVESKYDEALQTIELINDSFIDLESIIVRLENIAK